MSRLSRQRTANSLRSAEGSLQRAREAVARQEELLANADQDCRVVKAASGQYMALSQPMHKLNIGVMGDSPEQARRAFRIAWGDWLALSRRWLADEEAVRA